MNQFKKQLHKIDKGNNKEKEIDEMNNLKWNSSYENDRQEIQKKNEENKKPSFMDKLKNIFSKIEFIQLQNFFFKSMKVKINSMYL